jgi:hypothetical protein
MTEPVVVLSSAVDTQDTGDRVSNGGMKLYNNWAKALRLAGVEAYVCTTNGQYTPWLIEHQPHVPLAMVQDWVKAGRNVRGVTCWLPAQGFINTVKDLYYYDAELKWTLHFKALFDQYRERMRGIATHSRVQQGWYLAQNIDATYIPDWTDEQSWRPDDTVRVLQRVGFMFEGDHVPSDINIIQQILRRAGIEAEFIPVSGTEKEVRDIMQTCDVFLGLNPGKHPLWGEGCPRSQMEAMYAGAVVLAYDVRGNREYILDGLTGALVPRGHPERMGQRLKTLLLNRSEREFMRREGQGVVGGTFSSKGRAAAIKKWLEL